MHAAQWQIALSGMVPALVAMWLVDRLDRKRPEPARTRRLVAAAGMLSVIPALIIELFLEGGFESLSPATFGGAAFHAFGVAAIPEEACKILVVYWVVWRRPEFDERMDGIVYAGRAGLGFALVENMMYLLGTEGTFNHQLLVWVLRAVLAVPGHAMWTGMIGAYAARRRFDKTGPGLLGGFLLAVAFHGLYDFSLFVQLPLALTGHEQIGYVLLLVPILLTISGFIVLRRLARTALAGDDAEAERAVIQAAVAAVPA